MTIDQLKVLSLGYLTGSDMLQFCPGQLLTTQYERDSASLQRGADFAYDEFTGALNSKYDTATELTKTGTSRANLCVKLISILAIRNILAGIQHDSEKLNDSFIWADKYIHEVNIGQKSIKVEQASEAKLSNSGLVDSSFNTIG